MIRWLRDRLMWRAIRRGTLELAKGNTDMLIKILDFWAGWKTKVGLFAALLAMVAQALADVAALDLAGLGPIAAVAAILGSLKGAFLSLGGYGFVMKLLRKFTGEDGDAHADRDTDQP